MFIALDHVTGFVVVVCGGLLVFEGGVLQSQRAPVSSDSRALNCTWNIRVAAGRTVNLTFTEFTFAGSQGQCAGDYLVVSIV